MTSPPFFFFLSFLSIKGFSLIGPRGTYTTRRFDRDQILLPEVYIETIPRDIPADIRSSVIAPLDMLWNAVGEETNPYNPYITPYDKTI